MVDRDWAYVEDVVYAMLPKGPEVNDAELAVARLRRRLTWLSTELDNAAEPSHSRSDDAATKTEFGPNRSGEQRG